MANNEDSLMREVKEELEREKYEKLWNQYGNYLIAAAVGFVAAVAGYQYWAASSRAHMEAAGAKYETALALTGGETPSDTDLSKAEVEFASIVKDGPEGYSALAQMQLAGLQVETGKTDKALAQFEGLSKNTSIDPILREFAGLQAATLRVGDADWTEMENRLNPLTEGTAPWRFSALQLLGAAAFKAGKLDKAREIFNKLTTSREVPTSIRERASLYMSRIVASELAKEMPAANAARPAMDGSSSETNAAGGSDTEGASEDTANTKSGP